MSDGIRAARGATVGYIDIDLEVHARYIPTCVLALRQDPMSRRRCECTNSMALAGSLSDEQGYLCLMHAVLGAPLQHTETGFKFFRREAILPVLEGNARRRLVLGHRDHGAGVLRQASHRRDPRVVRAPVRQNVNGAIGAGTVIMLIRLINADRGESSALRIGRDCFPGDEVMIDLAAGVELQDQVTLAARTPILTHLNVGYRHHPLQPRFLP